jgi:hypothetical protein
MLQVLLIEDSPADALVVREAIRTSPVNADLLMLTTENKLSDF